MSKLKKIQESISYDQFTADLEAWNKESSTAVDTARLRGLVLTILKWKVFCFKIMKKTPPNLTKLKCVVFQGINSPNFPSQTHLLDCRYIDFFYFTVHNLSFFVSYFFTTWSNDLNCTKGFFYELKIVFCSGSQAVDAVQKQRGECALNKCTGTGLTLIKYGIQRSATGETSLTQLTWPLFRCHVEYQHRSWKITFWLLLQSAVS